tara:strand:- start:16888 stop:17406 length:519 start_codon:yes stop_codon:yes gene_type:complete
MEQGSLTALTGPIGVGKTTLARKLCADRSKIGETCLILSFATPIREMLAQLVGDEYVYENDLKTEPIEWLGGKTPRQLLQSLGTAWGRETIHPDIWVNAIKELILNIRKTRHDAHIYIDDLRFNNEAQMVHSLGGQILYLNRKGVKSTDRHTSERGISNAYIDKVLELTENE